MHQKCTLSVYIGGVRLVQKHFTVEDASFQAVTDS